MSALMRPRCHAWGMSRSVPRSVRVAGATLSILAVLAMVLWSLQRQMMYHPGGPPPPVQQVLPDGEEVTLTTADGLDLAAWWLPGGSTAVMLLPGNAGNRAGRVSTARALADQGLSVLLVEYRGYGGNPGSPSQEGLVADATAAADWLDARDDVEHPVYFGESLGAGVAVAVAVDRPPAALVLRSPFTSTIDVARIHFGPVPRFLVRDRFESEQHVAEVAAPVLVLATERDEVVPFELSRRVAHAADARLVIIDAAGHNAPPMFHGPQLHDAVRHFLDEHGLLPTD